MKFFFVMAMLLFGAGVGVSRVFPHTYGWLLGLGAVALVGSFVAWLDE